MGMIHLTSESRYNFVNGTVGFPRFYLEV